MQRAERRRLQTAIADFRGVALISKLDSDTAKLDLTRQVAVKRRDETNLQLAAAKALLQLHGLATARAG